MCLRLGSRGEMVRQVQRALHLLDDGIYGPITRDAVIAFQEQHRLIPDGIVGPATFAMLIPARLKRSKRKIREIIVHCTATPEGSNRTVQQIREYHVKEKGWSDIGYHYLIDLYGNILEGRDVDIIGAHCSRGGHNTYSIGVCYVGGCDKQMKPKDTRTELQKNSLLSLLMNLKKLYPDAMIYGHHDFDKGKECPCFDARTEYRRL